MTNSKFVHLHNHSTNSLLDGFGKPETYASVCKEMGFSHIAITDHGNVDGAIKFQNACKKEGIIPIFGCEFYIVPNLFNKEKGDKRSHIVALAKNETGWKNILRMQSISFLEGFYYRPRIDPEAILKHLSGLIIMTGCSLTFLNEDWGINLLNDIHNIIGNDLYIEIMNHDFDGQKTTNSLCISLSQEKNIKLVATNDCHYVRAEDAINHEVLLAVQTKKKWGDKDRWKFDGGNSFYLKSRNEMIDGFRKIGIKGPIFMEAMNNTVEIAEKCSGFTEIKKQKAVLPVVPKFKGEDMKDVLKRLCDAAFFKKIEMSEPARSMREMNKYRRRLDFELDLIFKQGFTEYFLIVWDLICWCQQNDIFVGPGRGSSSGSLVCYLLGITQIDPIEYDLVFARFISPDRIDLPDIDIDFEDTKRHLIRKYLEEQYGNWNVAGISTFSIMQGKSALRDVSRVFDIPLKEVNIAAGAIERRLKGDEGYDVTIAEALRTTDEGRRFRKKYPRESSIAIDMEGTIRQRGQHAAAIVISDSDLRNGNKCAFVLGKDKEPIINWDKEDMEYNGLMKLDVLGLSMLSVLNKVKKLVEEDKGKEIDFNAIKPDDKKCFEAFTTGDTIGCFQLGSPGLRDFCQKLGIDNFKMLVHANALYRPGTLRSGMADVFIRRKKGKEEIPEQHPIIEEITKDTYGVILYQEQMMRLVHELAGLEWKIADKIRKIIGKSQGESAFMEYKDMFVEGCLNKKTITREEAEDLWESLATFASYSFNLSHAVAYSMIAYWDMWCKIYYPSEFICALLTHGTTDEDKKNEHIDEAFRLEIDIRPPKIGISDPNNWIIKNNILYAPFIEIKGVGDKTASAFARIDREKGFFKKEGERSPSSKFLKILDTINAYNDVAITNEEAEKIEGLLSVSFINNNIKKNRYVRKKYDS